jgi:hypothetical protein
MGPPLAVLKAGDRMNCSAGLFPVPEALVNRGEPEGPTDTKPARVLMLNGTPDSIEKPADLRMLVLPEALEGVAVPWGATTIWPPGPIGSNGCPL